MNPIITIILMAIAAGAYAGVSWIAREKYFVFYEFAGRYYRAGRFCDYQDAERLANDLKSFKLKKILVINERGHILVEHSIKEVSDDCCD